MLDLPVSMIAMVDRHHDQLLLARGRVLPGSSSPDKLLSPHLEVRLVVTPVSAVYEEEHADRAHAFGRAESESSPYTFTLIPPTVSRAGSGGVGVDGGCVMLETRLAGTDSRQRRALTLPEAAARSAVG